MTRPTLEVADIIREAATASSNAMSALHRQAVFDARILFLRDLHLESILLASCCNNVNTP
jgi:hypothetical protein